MFGFLFRFADEENFLSFEFSLNRNLRRISRVFKGEKSIISQIIDQDNSTFKENELDFLVFPTNLKNNEQIYTF